MSRMVQSVLAKLRFSRYPLHGSARYAPFFIVGAGRSGTTLLRRILQASPEVHIPPETYVIGKAAHQFGRYQNLDWIDMCHYVYSLFEFHRSFGHFGISLRPLVQRVRKARGEERNLAYLIDAMFRYHGEETGKVAPRWGDKTPVHSLYMQEILSIFPDAKFIHMLRDGVDSAVSHVEGEIRGDMESAAHTWVQHVRAVKAFAAAHPEHVYEVRYEDLVQRPAEVVEPLCKYLGLPYDPAMLSTLDHASKMGDVSNLKHLHNVMNPINTSSIGKGRRALNDEDRQMLSKILDAELVSWGYEPLIKR